MAKHGAPHSFWFAHEDGRGVEVVVEDVPQLFYRPSHDHPAGLYIGSDPACDVVLDDPHVEGFHVVWRRSGRSARSSGSRRA